MGMRAEERQSAVVRGFGVALVVALVVSPLVAVFELAVGVLVLMVAVVHSRGTLRGSALTAAAAGVGLMLGGGAYVAAGLVMSF
ncbi:hypothetical protein [Yinghuangia soli]|uniref:Uncharacterized protein n=1 Tax=Yinghuangia soli TaxID=2908204 RepID=A0AA41Q1R5_9ACTN|nr:hypothetical protein [Yinghuangia soli]MCF2529161.1 hypothetical protein [Yinghuangia soli]